MVSLNPNGFTAIRHGTGDVVLPGYGAICYGCGGGRDIQRHLPGCMYYAPQFPARIRVRNRKNGCAGAQCGLSEVFMHAFFDRQRACRPNGPFESALTNKRKTMSINHSQPSTGEATVSPTKKST